MITSKSANRSCYQVLLPAMQMRMAREKREVQVATFVAFNLVGGKCVDKANVFSLSIAPNEQSCLRVKWWKRVRAIGSWYQHCICKSLRSAPQFDIELDITVKSRSLFNSPSLLLLCLRPIGRSSTFEFATRHVAETVGDCTSFTAALSQSRPILPFEKFLP